MAKLPNVRESLDAVVAMLDGRMLGGAELVAVSDLTTPAATDQKGVPWSVYVLKDYRVQEAAVSAGVIKKESALPPHFALDVLRSNDPEDDNYTVMGLVVPSSSHSHGIKTIGIIRPDLVRFEDGEPHVKLWFNALMDPAYHEGVDRAYLTAAGTPLVTDFLVNAAMERMERAAGIDDITVFSDDQCSMSIGDLVRGHGFKVLLDNVEVSSLPERRKSGLDTAANTVTLLVKPSKAYSKGMPLRKAEEMVKNYLVDGYDAPLNGRLVGHAMEQLRTNVSRGRVLYK